jgi:acetyl-CoA acetyltransferase
MSRIEGRPSFLGHTAISGVGYTEFTKSSGRTVASLAAEAARRAIDDSGLSPNDIDGIVSYSLFNDSVAAQAVATLLAIPELTYALDLNLGGQAPCFCIANAAMAVHTGMARNVVVFRALNGRSGLRVGSTRFEAPSSQYRQPLGLTAYPQYIALWAKRYMIETGATSNDLAAVVLRQRGHAMRNVRAIQRKAISLEQYLSSRYVVEPFRVPDCTSEVDGAVAMVVSSLAAARDGPVPPAVIQGAAWTTPKHSGLDIADIQSWRDYSVNCHHYLAKRLWQSARLCAADVDVAEIYDCFSAVCLMTLEGLGLVKRGEAGPFMASDDSTWGGKMPVNTHGGLLCEGYLHGMNTVAEAALQVQGRCGDRQASRADVVVATSGALMDGSALVLQRDG